MWPGARTPPTEFLNSVSPVKTLPSTSSESIPEVWPGVCSARDLEAADATLVAGLQVAGRAVDPRSSGWTSTCRSGQRSRSVPSSATWSPWRWVSSTWVGVMRARSAATSSGCDRPAGVDEERLAALLADEVGVRQVLRMHGALDDHRAEHANRPAATRAMPELIHTCYRIGDIDRSVAFYEALGFEESRRMPIRDEAINVFMGLPDDGDRASS